jgi:hypothetical protein
MCGWIGPGFALVGEPGYSPLVLALGEFVEIHILAAQARVLMWVGLAWLAVGLWCGYDPATIAWRAALGALVAMWASGHLMRLVVSVINERMATDVAERQATAEQAARAAQPATPVPRLAAGTSAAARPAPGPAARPQPAASAAAPVPAAARPANPAPRTAAAGAPAARPAGPAPEPKAR